MRYFDCNGDEIRAGMHIRMEDGNIEEVYATTDAYGNEDLGINASNEAYLELHPFAPREYYSLSNFNLYRVEIVEQKESMELTMQEVAMERVRPVGRIDYLSLSGKVCESCYFYSEAGFIKQVLQDNDYGTPMVVNVFRDKQGDTISLGFTSRLSSLPAGFRIIDYQEGEDMNEFQRLREMAKRYKELYKPGTRILLEQMGDDPRPIPPGTRGTVRVVDDMGTVHCDFDNGRRLGLVPGEDSFRRLTRDELLDERSEKLQTEFIDKVNKEVISCIEWVGMHNAYKRDNMEVPTDLLKMLHEKFVEVYGSDHVSTDDGMVTVPGVVQASDGKLYVALLDLDATSSGEHWGTTFFTPMGVLSDQTEDHDIKEEVRKMIPYNYWYTVDMERDHHVNWDECTERAIKMLQAAINMDQTKGVSLQ